MVITEKNFKSVAGRVKKFIKSDRNYLVWHQWTGGMRKRIGTTIPMDYDDDLFSLIHNPPKRYNTQHDAYEVECRVVDDMILINYVDKMDDSCGFDLTIGDEIRFYGNRIVTKTKSVVPKYKYCYEVLQIN